MGSFLGFVTLGNTLQAPLLTVVSGTPTNADALPTIRVYGEAGKGTGQGGFLLSGNAAFKDTNTLTNATNASPIVCTCAAHGLTTGARITITGVLTNTAANGTFVITVVDANTFSLNGTTGNGAYGGGGTWNTTGFYSTSLAATAINNFEAGKVYSILATFTISGTNYGDLSTFCVV